MVSVIIDKGDSVSADAGYIVQNEATSNNWNCPLWCYTQKTHASKSLFENTKRLFNFNTG